jgi:predicted acyltransferase
MLGIFLGSQGASNAKSQNNQGPPLLSLRIPGVLQYFSFSYLVVAFTIVLWEWDRPELALATTTAAATATNPATGAAAIPASANNPFAAPINRSRFRDIVPFWGEWLVCMALLVTFIAIQECLPVPGCPTGYTGPGGLAHNAAYFGKNCTGGAHRQLDVLIFGDNHFYQHPTAKGTYLTGSFDPEGALGMLTAAVMTFLGMHAGRILLVYKGDHKAILVRWVSWGVLLCLLAGALCGFKQNGGPVPINKNLWSTSFIFVMAGTGFLALSLCYLLVDVLKVGERPQVQQLIYATTNCCLPLSARGTPPQALDRRALSLRGHELNCNLRLP